MNLILGLLQPRLKLLGGHLEILDVSGSAVKEGHLARLLVGDGQSILESAVAIAKFIATPLLGLDALTANRLAAGIGASSRDHGLEVVVVLIGVIVARLASLRLRRRASSWGRDGVEAMRARDGSVRYAVDRGGGVGTTAAATSARSETIGGELASTEVVNGRGGDAVVWRGVGTTGGGGRVVGGGGVRVLADGVGQVKGVKVETGRRRRGIRHLKRGEP